MNTNRLLTITALILATASIAHAGVLAGPVANPSNGHSYYLLSPNTWTGSEAEAIALGGHLVTINDAEENQWVYSTFTALAGTPNASLWIGLNDANVEGHFVWASGKPVTFTSWFPGEPNDAGGTEDFAVIRPPSAASPYGSWNDQPDRNNAGSPDYPIFGVVEIEPARLAIEVASVALKWESATNTMYQLQYRSALTGADWVDLGTPIAGTGSNMVVMDQVVGEPRRFYRLRLLP